MMMLEAHLKKYGMKHCPIDNSVNILGKKFTLNILRNMILLKQKRFSEFIDSIEGINSKTLTTRLREMEEDDLIYREVISSKPLHTEYTVTEKGKMIEPMLEILAEFSMKYEPKVIFKDGKQRDMNELFGNNIRLSSVYDY